jgi:hypothetical protein
MSAPAAGPAAAISARAAHDGGRTPAGRERPEAVRARSQVTGVTRSCRLAGAAGPPWRAPDPSCAHGPGRNPARVVAVVNGAGGWWESASECVSSAAACHGARPEERVSGAAWPGRAAAAADLRPRVSGFGWSPALAGTTAGPPPTTRALPTSPAAHPGQSPAATAFAGFLLAMCT